MKNGGIACIVLGLITLLIGQAGPGLGMIIGGLMFYWKGSKDEEKAAENAQNDRQ